MYNVCGNCITDRRNRCVLLGENSKYQHLLPVASSLLIGKSSRQKNRQESDLPNLVGKTTIPYYSSIKLCIASLCSGLSFYCISQFHSIIDSFCSIHYILKVLPSNMQFVVVSYLCQHSGADPNEFIHQVLLSLLSSHTSIECIAG